jgi:hypothetical protein
MTLFVNLWTNCAVRMCVALRRYWDVCEAGKTLAVSNRLMVKAVAMDVCSESRSQRVMSNYRRADMALAALPSELGLQSRQHS